VKVKPKVKHVIHNKSVHFLQVFILNSKDVSIFVFRLCYQEVLTQSVRAVVVFREIPAPVDLGNIFIALLVSEFSVVLCKVQLTVVKVVGKVNTNSCVRSRDSGVGSIHAMKLWVVISHSRTHCKAFPSGSRAEIVAVHCGVLSEFVGDSVFSREPAEVAVIRSEICHVNAFEAL
jgi:hypothetical protein